GGGLPISRWLEKHSTGSHWSLWKMDSKKPSPISDGFYSNETIGRNTLLQRNRHTGGTRPQSSRGTLSGQGDYRRRRLLGGRNTPTVVGESNSRNRPRRLSGGKSRKRRCGTGRHEAGNGRCDRHTGRRPGIRSGGVRQIDSTDNRRSRGRRIWIQ